jgi:hypothetical protein
MTDALLAGTGSDNYVDVRQALLTAKNSKTDALYYKIDTHWNFLGAAVAFRFFAQQVGKAAPELKWPTEKAYEVSQVKRRNYGDLSGFLRFTIPDAEPITFAASLPVETTHFDLDTMMVVHRGGNPETIATAKPLLIKSVGALNNKKVLWLRDSFGTSMSPLMNATFSDVLQLHWGEALKPGGRFVQLVDSWKPDYVFITAVERDARSPLLTVFPQPLVVSRSSQFVPVRDASVTATTDLLKGQTGSNYRITGNAPFIEYAMSKPIKAADARYLSVD